MRITYWVIPLVLIVLVLSGCPKPEPGSRAYRDEAPPPPPPPEVTLQDLAAEKSPEADKLNAWRLQLQGKQAELETLRSELDERERALSIEKAGWLHGTIKELSVHYEEAGVTCKMRLHLDQRGSLWVETTQYALTGYCGSQDFGQLLEKEIWYADKKLSSEKPSGIMNVKLPAEREKK